ncbi:MAG: HAMP domain-containing histidine kinase [Clostridium sp.]|nr:HAMP domain-containing histidine kinase [Clostridium sp.]
MEENNKKSRLSYSREGKRFRGLLCMLTFLVFIFCMLFVVDGVDTYGTEIITNPQKDYRETDSYASQLQSEMEDLLYNIQEAGQARDTTVTITDAGKKKSYKLDLNELREEEVSIEQCLRDYRVTTKKESIDIEDYPDISRYLKRAYVRDNYLYLDTDDFISLFEADGYINTGYRFSSDFTQKAYFIFDYEGSYIQDVLNDNQLNSEIVQYDLSDEQYAVYDPETGTFYSVWDEYFDPMGSYIYRIGDLAKYIETDDINGIRYDSIIIPMLRCHNYEMTDLVDAVLEEYDFVQRAKSYLDTCAVFGIYYSLTYEDKTYSNADSEDIAKQEYSYRLIKKDVQEYVLLNGDGTPLSESDPLNKWYLNNDEWLHACMEDYPAGTELFYSIAPGMEDGLSSYIAEYSYFVYTPLFLLIAGAALILLVIQAVWLIRTTGRESREDTQIHLNRFDCLATEIWLVCGVALLGVWLLGFIVLRRGNVILSLQTAAVPFAFCFMMLTLSFARRVKAKNLWSGSLLYRVVRYFRREEESESTAPKSLATKCVRSAANGIKHCRDAYRQLSGTTRFTIGVAIYMLISCVLIMETYVMTLDEAGEPMVAIDFLWLLMAIVFMRRIIRDTDTLVAGVEEITAGNLDYKITLEGKEPLYQELTDGINHIGDGLKVAVETSLKDERMKTELITNVSHDLKTPLTSIINYINLLKTEKMPTSEAEHYIEVLDAKAQRLKQLTEDLVEAAKATSGNIEMEMVPLAFDELMKQALGEFEDKFATRNLTVIARYPEEPALIMADGRRVFRILENILQNAYKYALAGTRIYADLSNNRGEIIFTLKNVSAAVLNISPDELMERFTRGDASRTTEGSGLGLSIAKDLTRLQNGSLEIILDGDLFKVIVTFPEFVKDASE